MKELEKIVKDICKMNKVAAIELIKNALQKKDPDAFNKWRQVGFNINHLFYGLYTILHLAAENESVKTVEVLIKNGANVNAEDSYTETPLHRAARFGEIEVMKILLRHGSNVNALNDLKSTPLHTGVLEAPVSLKFALAKLLIENGAEVNATSVCREETPLHTVVNLLGDNIETIKILIGNGANVNALDFEKNTPLHLAAENDSIDVVKVLIENGANPNATNDDGDTPLHIAALNKHLKLVKYLVEKGANVHAENNTRKVPLACAREKGHEEIMKYLTGVMKVPHS